MTSAGSASNTGYKRFIVLSGPRTGSSLLVDALNSSPDIVCFGEIFNQRESIDYGVDGYDTASTEDIALRSRSPGEFLSKRIFCNHPEHVRAVGFKFHYTHFWGFPGIRQILEEDRDILVLHLQRHNLLRVLVSLKIAKETGIYFQHGGWRARSLPMIAGLFRRLFSGRAQPASPKVTISPDEFRQEAMALAMTAKHWEEMLAGHPIFPVSYEDMTPDPQEEFARAQSFLGVTPSKLRVAFVRQNPQKLEELIENYTELRNSLRGGPAEWMFSD